MNTALNDLLTYVRDSRVPSDALSAALSALGRKNVLTIAEELFTWLQRQDRMGHEKPLVIDPRAAWSQFIPQLFAICQGLNDLFVVTSDRIDFNKELTREARAAIRSFVVTQYRPVAKPLQQL